MTENTGKILVRLPPHIHQRLKDEARSSKRSLNQLCIDMFVHCLNSNDFRFGIREIDEVEIVHLETKHDST